MRSETPIVMKFKNSIKSIVALGLAGMLVSCASTPSVEKPQTDAAASAVVVEQSPEHTADYSGQSLGLIVRDMGTHTGNGLVLMNGMENIKVSNFAPNNATTNGAVSLLSKETGIAAHLTPHYTFLYDPAYESLVTLQIEEALPRPYREQRVDVSFGADTPLFSAMALLGRSTGLTLVADNAIGDAKCGELSLLNVPLPQALEALLQSARIPQSSIRIRTTDEYVFVYSAGHGLSTNLVAGEVKPRDDETLKENCSLSLLVYTTADNQVTSQLGASPLHRVLPELSLQLGMRVQATEEVQHLPVNPVVMNNVSRETALELLLHQWLVPDFRYEVRDGTILIRRA